MSPQSFGGGLVGKLGVRLLQDLLSCRDMGEECLTCLSFVDFSLRQDFSPVYIEQL